MKPSITSVIGIILSISSSLSHVSADIPEWELILSQKDVRVATFSPNVKSTYLENADNPDANTFTNIGNLNQSDYIDDRGYYKFRLIYTNLHDRSGDKSRPDNGLSKTIDWEQTSWITATTITGYTPINVQTEKESIQNTPARFQGLGLSGDEAAFLDGNAGDNQYWNTVGAIQIFEGGFPAFNGKIATAARLFVYSAIPTTSTAAATTTTTVADNRDCSMLDIDRFLMDCSVEFPSQILMVTDSISELEIDASTNHTIVQKDIKALRDEDDHIYLKIRNIRDRLTTIEGRIDAFGTNAAKTGFIGLIDNDTTGNHDVYVHMKDIMIISLLLINFVGLIYVYYVIQSKERRRFNGKKYAVQFDEESTDMEPIKE